MNSLIPSCLSASHEYQHGWACPTTEPRHTSLVTHIHTITCTHPYRHHLVQKSSLPALFRNRYLHALADRRHTRHSLPTNYSITGPVLSHFFQIKSDITSCVFLCTNFWQRCTLTCSVVFDGGGGAVCGFCLRFGGRDAYLDPTGRVKHKTDWEKEWDRWTLEGRGGFADGHRGVLSSASKFTCLSCWYGGNNSPKTSKTAGKSTCCFLFCRCLHLCCCITRTNTVWLKTELNVLLILPVSQFANTVPIKTIHPFWCFSLLLILEISLAYVLDSCYDDITHHWSAPDIVTNTFLGSTNNCWKCKQF